MQTVTDEIRTSMEGSSWIRKMFEKGIELKKRHGADAVCDFSLGNPDVPPPAAAKAALEAHGWDMIDAVIGLEREGKVKKTASEQTAPKAEETVEITAEVRCDDDAAGGGGDAPFGSLSHSETARAGRDGERLARGGYAT